MKYLRIFSVDEELGSTESYTSNEKFILMNIHHEVGWNHTGYWLIFREVLVYSIYAWYMLDIMSQASIV